MLILSNNYHKDWKTIIVKYLGDLINDMFRFHKRYVYDSQTICLRPTNNMFIPTINNNDGKHAVYRHYCEVIKM